MSQRDRIAATARQAEALRLRANGLTFDQIGRALGGVSRQASFKLVSRALAASLREPAEQLRVLELERLDQLQVEAFAVLRRRHLVAQGGRIVRGDDGQPLIDDGPILAAVATALRIMERRARLLGLDAPARHDVKAEVHQHTVEELDREIELLMAELAEFHRAEGRV